MVILLIRSKPAVNNGRRCIATALACLTGLLTLTGCDALLAPEIEDCEQFVLGKLKAPSTFARVDASKTVMDSLTPPELWVSIEYDAANAYGTPIRDTQICKYPIVNGHADISGYIDHDAPSPEAVSAMEEVTRATEAAVAKAANEPVSPQRDTHETASGEASDAKESLDLCWEGYCPCDPPQGGPDQLLCDALRRGDADPKMLSVGKSMRETRRQIDEYQF